jgi:hypothetical protein
LKKQIDLFRVLESGTDKAKQVSLSPAATGLILIIALLVIGFAAGALMIVRDNSMLSAERDALRDYVDNSQNMTLYDELNALQADTGDKIAYISLTQAVSGMIGSTPRFDEEVYGVILANKPLGVTLTGIEYASGIITLSCITSDNMPPSDFAQGLDQCGQFSSVRYTGFSQMAEGQLQFTIVCQ